MSLNSNRLDAFLSHLGVERNLSPATIQSYQEDLRHFVAWLDDCGIDLKDLKPEKLDEFLTLTAGQVEYSPTSVARHFSSLRGFLKYMQNQGEYDYSTESMLATPKLGHYLPQYLTREEIDSVFESAANGKNPLRDTALIELMYSGGLRISEALGIKLSKSISTTNGSRRLARATSNASCRSAARQKKISVPGLKKAVRSRTQKQIMLF